MFRSVSSLRAGQKSSSHQKVLSRSAVRTSDKQSARNWGQIWTSGILAKHSHLSAPALGRLRPNGQAGKGETEREIAWGEVVVNEKDFPWNMVRRYVRRRKCTRGVLRNGSNRSAAR